MPIALPLHIDARGRTAQPTDDEQVRALLEAVLFTAPGERPNRPAFGTAIQQLVFTSARDEVAAVVRALIQGALVQQLGDRIVVESTEVSAADNTLTVVLTWRSRTDPTRHRCTLQRSL